MSDNDKNKPATTLESILAYYREAAQSNRDLGDSFERLVARYLLTDPQYADRLSDVWLWSEWPDRWNVDVGIDLVARERSTGEYWAIQCKFFDPASYLQKVDIDSFFTASGKKFGTKDGQRQFSHRLIISTTDKWSKHAEEALADQVMPVSRLWFKELANSPVDWSGLDVAHPGELKLQKKKTPRPHQDEAIELSEAGFKTADRGKLIMACGTGKTFTSLRLAEKLTPKSGRILFLAPSISLVSQTLREWTAQATDPLHAFVVCSDAKVGKDDEEDIKTHDLAYPATTDAKALARVSNVLSKDRRTVVFSTYQSIQVLSDAQKMGFGEFDLIVCDEAHRTTGLTLANQDPSDFVKVHQNSVVKGKKRLYMTATPRIYGDPSKQKATEKEAVLFSMDDEATFGPEFYRLSFGKAVDLDLLAEYKVLIVAVEEEAMANLANSYNNAYKLDEKKAVDIKFATKIIGAWKGLSKQGLVEIDGDEQVPLKEDTKPMRRAVAFSRSIKDSKQTTEVFGQLVGMYNRKHLGEETPMVHCELDHVDGGMNALVRQNKLDWLKGEPAERACKVLSNARCLSEGIDVPALDAVAFFDTRESIVDIVQSVGRVMRKAEGKKYGYIILPVCIPSSKVAKYNDYIESDAQFKGIWRVIKALRAHDESLVDEAEFRRKITVIGGRKRSDGGGGTGGGDNLPLDFPEMPLDAVTEAVYAAIPKKLGDREYWSQWAKDVAVIAERLVARIKSLLEKPKPRKAFDSFLKGLRENLNPTVGEEEAIEMLAQHVITRPVFEALFDTYSFTTNNPVSSSMQKIVELLDAHEVDSETEGLEKFYKNVRERVSLAKSEKSKQDIIRNLYDTFFGSAFPRVAERLGIVYTPIEVVDFIIQSVEVALQRHFKVSMSDSWVQLLDPFTGTGTFPVRLLHSGLIKPADLQRKFQQELHANEIVLLAYYIATINIESAYYGLTGEHLSFEGIVLTDTFQMNEAAPGDLERGFSEENSKRATKQKKLPIRVVFSNPPYSAQQESENDNNKNLDYPVLDERIKKTYAAKSGAKLLKNLYDSYVRAIRWASDRIEDRGIVAFVTNGSFLDANNMDGLRKCLVEDFTHLYIFNCRGNARTQGEERRKESGGIFGEGSKTRVAISILVKEPGHKGPSKLHYYDIGDYLTREQKLAKIEELSSIASVDWQMLKPNADGDWAEQRDPAFETFVPMGDKEDTQGRSFFVRYSLGVSTNRDAWVYNSSRMALEATTKKLVDNFNSEVKRCSKLAEADTDGKKASAFVERDAKKIAWSSTLLGRADREEKLVFDPTRIVPAAYRPFNRQWQYLAGGLNDRPGQALTIFPTENHRTPVISVTGQGASKSFSGLIVDSVPNLHFHDTGQYFPLYWYEKIEPDEKSKGDLFAGAEKPDEHGYLRRDGISDWALEMTQRTYKDKSITKEDVFWYVYGILQSPEYKQRFGVDLKKGLPRLPLAGDFWAFSRAGKQLGTWHLEYEEVKPFELQEDLKRLVMEPNDYKVGKMVFGKKDGKPDKSVIVYNENLILRGIPAKAYEYQVNGKSAIEWVMERYQVTIEKDSQIKNDPNAWSDDARYIVDLVKRVVRVSVESAKIIEALPPLQERGI